MCMRARVCVCVGVCGCARVGFHRVRCRHRHLNWLSKTTYFNTVCFVPSERWKLYGFSVARSQRKTSRLLHCVFHLVQIPSRLNSLATFCTEIVVVIVAYNINRDT